MPSEVELFGRMLVIGVAVAAPVGAMGVLCIQRVLARGFRAGLVTGAGIATADGIYAGVAAFGVAAVSSALVAWQAPLRIAGGLVLIWLAYMAVTTPPACDAPAQALATGALAPMYAGTVGLTLTNPMTIMAFAAVFAGAGVAAQPGVLSAATATLGVALGSFAWWVVLSAVTSLARHAAGERALVWVNRVSGGLIGIFGLVALGTGVWAFVAA